MALSQVEIEAIARRIQSAGDFESKAVILRSVPPEFHHAVAAAVRRVERQHRNHRGRFWIAGLFAAALVVSIGVGAISRSGGTDGPSESYTVCEAAARGAGLDPSSPDGLEAIGTCMSRYDNPTTTATVANDSGTGALTHTETCDRFLQIVGDLTMDDEESAAAFHVLAGRVQDPGQADAVRAVARAFDQHDEAISSEPVMAYCP